MLPRWSSGLPSNSGGAGSSPGQGGGFPHALGPENEIISSTGKDAQRTSEKKIWLMFFKM